MMKKLLAIALTLMLTFSCLAGICAYAEPTETSYTAGMGLVADDWSVQTGFGADSSVKTTVTGDGTYTLNYEGACPNLGILVVDIIGAQAAMDADGKTWQVSDIALTIDGTAVEVDGSKVLSGDLEGNGNFRIELNNMYGGTKDAPALNAATAVTTSLSVSFTLTTIDKPVADTPAAGLPEEFDVFVAFGGDKAAENDWGLNYAGADAEGITAVGGKLKVGETITVSLSFETPAVNAWYFAPCLIADGVSAIKTLDFTITCKINGEEVTINMDADAEGKTWWTEDTGDFKGNCIRLAGGFNEWGTKYIEEPTNISSIEYTITLNAISGEGGSDEPVEEPTLEFDPTATYNAYLLLQTPNWTYRDPWNSNNGIGSDYWGEAIYGNETKEWYGKVTDAVLAGNGTYTIEITDFGTIFADDFAAAGQDYFNILGFTCDAPVGGLTFTNVKLIVDGSTRHTVSEGYQNPDDTKYANILIQNIWNDDVKEISYYPAPSTSLKIEFTVSGFSYDKAVDEPEPTTPAPTTPAPSNPGNAEPASFPWGIVIAVVAAVVVVAVVIVVVKKKDKKQ